MLGTSGVGVGVCGEGPELKRRGVESQSGLGSVRMRLYTFSVPVIISALALTVSRY